MGTAVCVAEACADDVVPYNYVYRPGLRGTRCEECPWEAVGWWLSTHNCYLWGFGVSFHRGGDSGPGCSDGSGHDAPLLNEDWASRRLLQARAGRAEKSLAWALRVGDLVLGVRTCTGTFLHMSLHQLLHVAEVRRCAEMAPPS